MTSSWPTVAADDLLWVGTDHMRQIDRFIFDELGYSIFQTVENAGRSLAEVVRVWCASRQALVLVGPGGNGLGGLVAARHLAATGVAVTVVLTAPKGSFTGPAGNQLAAVGGFGVRVVDDETPLMELGVDGGGNGVDDGSGSDGVIIDAMVGYSLRGELQGTIRTRAEEANAHPWPVLALDNPSGVSADAEPGNGAMSQPESSAAEATSTATDPETAATPEAATTPGVAIQAHATLTLSLPKHGPRDLPGTLFIADTTIPPAAVEAVVGSSTGVPPFHLGQILRLD